MTRVERDVVVVGGGAAGMAAASVISENGHSVSLIERESCRGGILNQCIHNGFGLHYFGEELTGPEYAERFSNRLAALDGVEVHTNTTAVDILSRDGEGVPGDGSGFDSDSDPDSESRQIVYAVSPADGLIRIDPRAVVLALGCRERNRGNIGIPGTRPSGIFTAGLAQRLVNIEGYVPGRHVVIVGSGDIGLIMARRMRWVGAEVLGVVEIQQYPSGITRNIVQCLNDFDIPLFLSHVVSRIHGRDRIEAVDVSPLEDGKPDVAKTFRLECDTLLLSVGLIPDNELLKKAGIAINPETNGPHVDASLMTSVPGVFACGNGLHVHDLVDYASEEAEYCGRAVSRYIDGESLEDARNLVAGANLRYVIPERVAVGRENVLFARSLIVKNDATLIATSGESEVFSKHLRHVQPSEMIRFVLAPDEEIRGDVEVRLQ